MACSTEKKKAKVVRGFAGSIDIFLTSKETGRPYNLANVDTDSLSGWFPAEDTDDADGVPVLGEVVNAGGGQVRFAYTKAQGEDMAEGDDMDIELEWTEDDSEPMGLILEAVLEVVSRQLGA